MDCPGIIPIDKASSRLSAPISINIFLISIGLLRCSADNKCGGTEAITPGIGPLFV